MLNNYKAEVSLPGSFEGSQRLVWCPEIQPKKKQERGLSPGVEGKGTGLETGQQKGE